MVVTSPFRMKPSLLFFPRLSISPIRRDQSCPSSIINDPGPASAHVGQVRTRQTASKQAQQQLQDPTAQLTDDVLDLLLQYMTRTSRTPDAKVLDPLYVQANNNRESRQPPVCFTRIYESHPSPPPEPDTPWSLAVLRPEPACIKQYNSLHNRRHQSRV
ncbi:uncharacterized protein FRV6_10238 [Fusarium oxysporum]|uniref:Uncharacterized protein n=1 Tax=Fusarium oxysporum TaxID=5507 RepID=A0A2H3TK55_FUSOX|nr:uncharacterized protein FRV6_10238 [Fusarium oxysporum]